MKHADRWAKAVTLLLFAAMLCYVGFAVARRLSDPVRTALAVETELTDSVLLQGLVIRRESVLTSHRDYIDISAAEGEQIAAGGAVAVVYTSAQALDRALRLENLEQELRAAERSADEPANAAGGVWSAMQALQTARLRGDFGALELRAEALQTQLGQGGEAAPDAEYLYVLRSERDSLRAAVDIEAETIAAPTAGRFSAALDGYEGLDLAAAEALTPQRLQALLDESRSPDGAAFGKLVEGPCWYYAALLDEQTAESLRPGQELRLRFSRFYAGELPATLLSLSGSEGGQCVALFELDRAMAELLPARKCGAELVFGAHQGLRSPREGLWRYWAGTVSAEDAKALSAGQRLTLELGDWRQEGFLSECGEPDAQGRCELIFCWAWSGENGLPADEGAARLCFGERKIDAERHYPAGEEHLCVFTMTGRQAERKKVSLVYAGEDFCLLSSEGEDALRAGNEIIAEAQGLFDGKVFDTGGMMP